MTQPSDIATSDRNGYLRGLQKAIDACLASFDQLASDEVRRIERRVIERCVGAIVSELNAAK